MLCTLSFRCIYDSHFMLKHAIVRYYIKRNIYIDCELSDGLVGHLTSSIKCDSVRNEGEISDKYLPNIDQSALHDY